MGSPVVIVVIVVIVVLAVVAVAVATIGVRRRRSRAATGPAATLPPPRVVAAPAPMTGLESALATVTDRDGRPIQERIDAESIHVDPLRDPNDTGPLLRRVLDSVEHHDPEPLPPPIADEARPTDL